MNKIMAIAIFALVVVTANAQTSQTLMVSGPGTYSSGTSQKVNGTYVVTGMRVQDRRSLCRLMAAKLKGDGGRDGGAQVTTQTLNGKQVILLDVWATPEMQKSIAEQVKAINAGETLPFSPGIESFKYTPKYRSAAYLLDFLKTEMSAAGYAYANPEANVLTVVDDPGFFQWFRDVLDFNDQPSPSVKVELEAVELNEEAGKNIGLYWKAFLEAMPERASFNFGGSRTPMPANDLQISAFGGTLDGISPQAWTDFVHFLVTKGVAKIHSKTTIPVTNGKPATFSSGQTIPYTIPAKAGRLNEDRDAFEGVAVDIQSIISREVSVRLTFDVTVSSIVGWAPNGSPIVSKSHMTVASGGKHGDTSVHCLSGLDVTRKVVEREGVPLLSRIPYIRWFFSHEVTKERKTETVISWRLVTDQVLVK